MSHILMCVKEKKMNYYIDVIIQPNDEIRLNVLLNSVYTNFHKVLFDLRSTSIGISFPRYKITLGNIMRIHAQQVELNIFQDSNWLGSISPFCKVTNILEVPQNTKFRTISRKQSTMSQSKLNRLIKRGSIKEDEIINYKTKMFSKGLDDPYIELQSGSNGHKHRRYLEFGELLSSAIEGRFDQFGLSKSATIPWFE